MNLILEGGLLHYLKMISVDLMPIDIIYRDIYRDIFDDKNVPV